jgi:Fic family protein
VILGYNSAHLLIPSPLLVYLVCLVNFILYYLTVETYFYYWRGHMICLKKIPQDYLDDMLVRLAHHSAGIEGNTISLPATVSIILNGILPVSGGATVREFYEIENHKIAFSNLLDHLENNDKLSVAIIKEIHADLTDRLQYDKGQFKKKENMIIGAEFQTATPGETPFLIQQLVDKLEYGLENAATEEEQLESILDTHIQLEGIHPFSDGNGRTGRMLMNYSLLQEGFPPLIIEKETKAIYIEILAKQDLNGFMSFANEILAKEQNRMQAFQNMNEENISYD